MTTMKIGFIGGGNMASALIGGLLEHGFPASDLYVIDHSDAARATHQAKGVRTGAGIDATLAECDAVVFAIKPQHFRLAALDAAPHVGKALIISIAAGIRLVDIARWLNGHSRVVRAMPNTPALIGRGITGLGASEDVGQDERAIVEQILKPTGAVMWFDANDRYSADDRIDAVTAISGSGPAYIFAFIEALEDAGTQLGFSAAEARALAVATVTGAGELAARSSEAPAVLRQRVTSPGGTTAAALASFTADDFHGTVVRGAKAAQTRAKSLALEMGKDPETPA
jgi:pyrroline-5-carboxylate reductase